MHSVLADVSLEYDGFGESRGLCFENESGHILQPAGNNWQFRSLIAVGFHPFVTASSCIFD